MKRLEVTNPERSARLGARIDLANTMWTRLRGLLGRPPLTEGEGMLLVPCRAVHMFGMKQALDVAFLDDDGMVVALYHGLQPGKRSGWHGGARQALELPVGTLERTGTQVGDRLRIETAA